MKEIMIDVRELYEFNAERVEDSLCIPMSMMESWGIEKIINLSKPSTKIIIMCHSWARAWVIKQFIESKCDGPLEVYQWWIIARKNNWNKTI